MWGAKRGVPRLDYLIVDLFVHVQINLGHVTEGKIEEDGRER